MNISVFGTGYVGLVTGLGLAELGHKVVCVDLDEDKIRDLSNSKVSFYEPGVQKLLEKNIEKSKISFITDPQKGVEFGEVIFNCVGTPGREDGSANLDYVLDVARNVAEYSTGKNKLLVNKSTVPPGTARKCQEVIKDTNNLNNITVVSNPEFLREGSAFYDFTHPDKIVIGAQDDFVFGIMRKVYTGRLRTYIPILETNWETAEIIKYANNSFLATKISFINEIANICDKIGADVKVVSQAMGLDNRISPKFLSAGIGYGGSCFPKDVRALNSLARNKGYSSRLLREVDSLNERQRKIIIEKVTDLFGQDLSNKLFTIWGLSFKPKTSDIRESPASDVVISLLEKGARLKVYDPVAMDEFKKIFPNQVEYSKNIEDSVLGSEGIILLTEWDEFRNVNFLEIGKSMKSKCLFDGRNIYEPALINEEGFKYLGIGRK